MTSALLLLALAEFHGRSRIERQLSAMGTALVIVVDAGDRASSLDASERAVRAVERAENRLSTWRDTSELSRLNRSAPSATVQPSTELREDLLRSVSFWKLSDGAFDPTVGALVAVWDLRGVGRRPSESELQRARDASGLGRAITIDATGVTRNDSAASIEEGAFGKGIALDAALAEWKVTGARGSVDLGGQVAVLGDPTVFALADPRDRYRPILLWRIETGSIATSANSERCRVVDGVKIGHILDPRTGMPAHDFGSVSVECGEAARADAFSTAAFVLGPERALDFAQRVHVEMVLVECQGGALRARATPGLRGRLECVAPDVRLEFTNPITSVTPTDEGDATRGTR